MELEAYCLSTPAFCENFGQDTKAAIGTTPLQISRNAINCCDHDYVGVEHSMARPTDDPSNGWLQLPSNNWVVLAQTKQIDLRLLLDSTHMMSISAVVVSCTYDLATLPSELLTFIRHCKSRHGLLESRGHACHRRPSPHSMTWVITRTQTASWPRYRPFYSDVYLSRPHSASLSISCFTLASEHCQHRKPCKPSYKI